MKGGGRMPKVDKSLYVEIGKIIKHERRKKKISLDRLVDMLGGEKTKSTLKRYEDGTSRIDVDVLASICDKLDIDYKDVVATAKARSISKSKDGFNVIYIDDSSNEYNRLQMHDNSMSNIDILNDDIVFYLLTDNIQNNDLVAVQNETTQTIRRYVYYENVDLKVLKAENSDYKDIVLSEEDDVEIIGKVVAFQRTL